MITDELINKIGDSLVGTCQTADQVVQFICDDPDAIDIDEVEDRLLDINVEECVICNWWFDSSDLTWHDDRNGGICDDCLEK